MLEDFKKEIHSFLYDMNKNIKNKEDLIYVQQRTSQLIDAVLDNLEKITSYKDEQINSIIKNQEKVQQEIEILKEKMEEIYNEMYEEEESNFLVTCPYCNCEFDADIDDNINEIKCPECGNIIELDWNGNPDDDEGECNRRMFTLWRM